MANTKKPPSSKSRPPAAKAAVDSLELRLLAQLVDIVKPDQTVLVGLSGGIDSVVLLHMLISARAKQGFKLKAMHIHHGLSPNADAWASFCETLCQSLDIPLQIVRVQIPEKPAIGIEAAARAARYQALFDDISSDFVAVAHHLDDQVETLLLQLIRGAGIKGLAAMPSHHAKRRLLRPLLDVTKAEIEAYAKLHHLQWVEDESNLNSSYDRNYLRHDVLPGIEQRFAGAKSAIARSASHLAEASSLLDDLAVLDAERCMHDQRLSVKGLQSLSDARARNLLRWWLNDQGIRMPSSVRLQEILKQLVGARQDAQIRLPVGTQGIYLRRYQDAVYVDEEKPSFPFALTWNGEEVLTLPDGSSLRFMKDAHAGLAFERLGIERLRIAQRVGGERFKPDLSRPSRTLKHLLQEANMPPWQRQRLPLIYHEDRLAVVPGIGVSAELQAREHEPAMEIIWQPAE
jgi:tRNA(Ile)-lysidine synthase